jgi:hypothetical protein
MPSCSIKTLLATLLVLCLIHPAEAQDTDASPYSVYGFGDLVRSSQISQVLMGGAGVAIVEPFSVINVNPASYAGLLHTTFEGGVTARNFDLRQGDQEEQRSSVEIQGFSLGLPFGKGRWGLAMGINPASWVGYNVNDRGQVPEGDVRFQYSGSGGLDKVFVGLGHALREKRDTLGNGHRLSVGANFNYLFGAIERDRKAYYPQGGGYYNTSASSRLVLSDAVFNFGVLFQGDLVPRKAREDDPLRFTIGAFLEPGTDMGARRDELVTSFVLGGSDVEFVRDTVRYLQGTRGAVFIPAAYGVGATVHNTHWTVTLEHRRRDWTGIRVDVEGYATPGDVGSSASTILGASYRRATEFGGEWSFWDRAVHRVGLRVTEDYLRVQGQQLREIGMTIGTSLPLMHAFTRSRFNIGMELGKRGNTDDTSISERFLHVHIGLTITPDLREKWLIKRRIE